MKKRLLAVLVAAVTAVSLLACGGGSGSSGGSGSADAGSGDAAASDMKVAMVTDYGDITDQSFNQTTYEACKAFTEANGIDFTYYKPEGDSTAEREAMIDKAVADGYNVLVLPGYAFAEAIVAAAETYTDVKFVALDVSEYDLCTAAGTDTYSQDNVYSAVYQEEISGYMAGYAAVKMGYKKLGFLGGMAVPAVIRYGYGFVQGANAAAEEMGIADQVSIKYTYGGQFFGEYWEQDQWNLFYNFMAECLLLYFEAQAGGWGVNGSGLIEAPCDNIERRQMRQQMTEGFYRWAMDYYNIDEDNPSDPNGTRLGETIERPVLFESYKLSVNRRELTYITPQKFWQRLVLFCRYWGYTLNPHIPTDAHGRPGHDKSNGTERVTISHTPFSSTPQ